MRTTAKLGLITTGQGPRNEYVRYNSDLLAHLGVDVEIRIVNAMDDMSREEIRAIESKPGERYIGSHIHEPGSTGDRMGDDWGHVWTDADPLIPLFQNCIDMLEADGVDATVLCCAEEYPVDAFRSSRPLIIPWLVTTEWVRVSTMYIAEPTIGILIPDEEHRAEDMATWTSQPWMRKLKIVMEPIASYYYEPDWPFKLRKDQLDDALDRLKLASVDLAMFWGYGFGIGPADSHDLLLKVYRTLNVPFLTIQRLVGFHLRNVLLPSLNDRDFVGTVVNPAGQPALVSRQDSQGSQLLH